MKNFEKLTEYQKGYLIGYEQALNDYYGISISHMEKNWCEVWKKPSHYMASLFMILIKRLYKDVDKLSLEKGLKDNENN